MKPLTKKELETVMTNLIYHSNAMFDALRDLRSAYAKVQEHHGFKPEDSVIVRNADSAMRQWVEMSVGR